MTPNEDVKLYHQGSSYCYSYVLAMLENRLARMSNSELYEWLDERYKICARESSAAMLRTDPYIWGQIDAWGRMTKETIDLPETVNGVEFLRDLAIAEEARNQEIIGQ